MHKLNQIKLKLGLGAFMPSGQEMDWAYSCQGVEKWCELQWLPEICECVVAAASVCEPAAVWGYCSACERHRL